MATFAVGVFYFGRSYWNLLITDTVILKANADP